MPPRPQFLGQTGTLPSSRKTHILMPSGTFQRSLFFFFFKYLSNTRIAQMVKKICPQCGSIPGLGRSPGRGHGNPLQYFCLENPMDRGAWRATVYGIAKSQTQLSN